MNTLAVSSLTLIEQSAKQNADPVVQEIEYILGFALLLPCAAAVIALLAVLIFKKTPPRHPKTTTAGVLALVAWAIPLVPIVTMMITYNEPAKPEQKSSESGGALCCAMPLDFSGFFSSFESFFLITGIVVALAMSSVFTFVPSLLAVKFGRTGRRLAPDGAGRTLIKFLSTLALILSICGLIAMMALSLAVGLSIF